MSHFFYFYQDLIYSFDEKMESTFFVKKMFDLNADTLARRSRRKADEFDFQCLKRNVDNICKNTMLVCLIQSKCKNQGGKRQQKD